MVDVFGDTLANDADVIAVYTRARADLSMWAAEEARLERLLQTTKARRLDYVARAFAGREIGDGRDLRSIAPKTTAHAQTLQAAFAQAITEADRAREVIAKLWVWYPATLLQHGAAPQTTITKAA